MLIDSAVYSAVMHGSAKALRLLQKWDAKLAPQKITMLHAAVQPPHNRYIKIMKLMRKLFPAACRKEDCAYILEILTPETIHAYCFASFS